MRKIYYLLIFIPFLLTSSVSDFNNPSDFYPILMERSVLEKSVFIKDVQEIIRPGKIYYKDNMIYLNELYKGIHVINNTNPAAPETIAFINIPGCIDIAIKNNSLLADNAIDLVSIDLSNGLQNISVTSRTRNVFPESTPPDLDYIPSAFSHSNRPENTIIIGWESLLF
ncbi:MAG: hypothetical protein GQ564_02795 [Bacteroidales bacterium]|nr:hypothetical protein [Bacteroidales bacterium]